MKSSEATPRNAGHTKASTEPGAVHRRSDRADLSPPLAVTDRGEVGAQAVGGPQAYDPAETRSVPKAG